MRFAIYQAPFEQTAIGYAPDAAYALVWEGEVAGEPRGADASEALEGIFKDFQRVDPDGLWPPEGYEGRSLSVGDVVVLDGWAAFAVENVGFAAVKFSEPARPTVLAATNGTGR